MEETNIGRYITNEKKPSAIDRALLSLLGDGGVSLAEAAEKLQQDEWYVLERIKELVQMGLPITAEQEDRFVALKELRPLSAKQVKSALHTQAKKLPMYVAWSVPSTNESAIEVAKELRQGAFLIIAEQQTKGRGRRGKDWLSPFGENLYLSYKADFDKGAAQLSGLSLVVGVAVASTLKNLTGTTEISIKWPNDVYYKERKLGGVLIEVIGDMQGACSAVVGLGVNGVLPEHEVGQPVAALEEFLPSEIERNVWVALIIDAVYNYVERFKIAGLASFLAEWKEFDLLFDKEVVVYLGDREITGRALGLAESGELLIKVEGKVQSFSAGEVSVRKNAAFD